MILHGFAWSQAGHLALGFLSAPKKENSLSFIFTLLLTELAPGRSLMWKRTWKGLGLWLCQCFLHHKAPAELDRAGYVLGSMTKYREQHRLGMSSSEPGYVCLPFSSEHSLLLQLFFIMFGNRSARAQLGLPVLGEQASCSVVLCEFPWPRVVIFNTPKSSRGQFSPPLVCVHSS